MADQKRNTQGAERKYLEVLHFLTDPDLIQSDLINLPHVFFIISELGSNSLYSFAKILEDQSKYKYAILLYHACGQVYHLRGCTKEYFTLLGHMANYARECDDFTRSLNYYKELLQHYLEQKRRNEVSEILFFFKQNGE